MEHVASVHRIRLLGELEVFAADGTAVELPADRVMQRLLVALAMRAGQPRRIDDLIAVVWPGSDSFNRGAKSLESPVSRLRGKLGMPIPPRRGQAFYRLDLIRRDVDALDFIDAVQADELPVPELLRLVSLWRGDPRVVFGSLPDSEWSALQRAVGRLAEHLGRLSVEDARVLRPALGVFGEVFPEVAEAIRLSAPVPAQRQRRLLIVENEPLVAKMLASILYDYQTVIAMNLEEAMRVVTEQLADVDGALIDLHLTERLDSAGLEVLAYIRDRRPELPRLLITASPPPGSQEQMRRTYGIVDILVKGADGYSASGVRDAVGVMFNESEEAVRRRSVAEFESHAVQIQRQLRQQIVTARRGIRAGERTSYGDLERATDRMARFEEESDELRGRLVAASTDGLDEVIVGFVARWPLAQRRAESAG
ncbi:hypothetical protein GCM10022225_25570 [Plantactinospora mayteni]|uniref:Response regulatory domain-containing protein n=1 Tax=Plantactinospora mayteni TaxID=566021 RepID=A0ABQ4EJ20_9ACTN|nr:response regulator [Plantactinospora mayteni]GIG94713.1 hypothetical protein Pma05_12860 [Plantactinospora mayteni]